MAIFSCFGNSRKRRTSKPRARTRNRLAKSAFALQCELLEDRCMLSISAPTDQSALLGIQHRMEAAPSESVATYSSNQKGTYGSTPQGLTPDFIRNYYGYSTIPTIGGAVVDGAGQTIAIIDTSNDPNIFSDVDAFDQMYSVNSNGSYYNLFSRYGSSSSFLTVANEWGDTNPAHLPNTVDYGAVEETALDVEWAHATAPGAKVVLIEANNLNIIEFTNSSSVADVYTAVDTARNWPGVSVVSMSWGFAEYMSETYDDFHFTTPAGHNPVTFVAATGDSGPPAAYPAFSPNVVAVGGTSLTYSNGSWSELPWLSSGGGQSAYEAEPLFQGVVQHTGKRTTPDISLNAGTGMSIYNSDQQYTPSQGNWSYLGGTSFGAPMWSAIVALSNEERAIENMSTLDGPHETLPRLYSMPGNFFNDITNQGTLAGYDQVTGIGSPHVNAIVPSFDQSLSPAAIWVGSSAQVAEVDDNVSAGWQDLFVVGPNGLVREDQYNTSSHAYSGQFVIDTSTVFAAGTKLLAYSDGTGTTNSLNLFAIGTDGHIKWAQQKNGGQWTNFTTIDAGAFSLGSGEGLWAMASAGYLSLYGVGADGNVKEYQYNASQNRWADVDFGASLHFNPGTPLSGVYDAAGGDIQIYGQLANGDIGEWLATNGWSAYDLPDGGGQFPSPAGGAAGIPLLVVAVNSWTDIFGVTTSGNVGMVRISSLHYSNNGGTLNANGRYVPRSAISGTEYADGTTVLFGADQLGDITEVQYSGGWSAPVIYPTYTYVAGSQLTFVAQPNGTWELLGIGNNGDLLDEEHATAWTPYDLH